MGDAQQVVGAGRQLRRSGVQLPERGAHGGCARAAVHGGLRSGSGERELFGEPAMGQATAVDVHHRVPGAGAERTGDRLEHARVQVGEVAPRADPEYRKGAGHVDELPLVDQAGADEPGRLVAGPGRHRHPLRQIAGRGRLARQASHHLGRRHDARQPGQTGAAEAGNVGQLRRPAAARRVAQPHPGKVGGIDERLFGLQPGHAAGNVAGQRHHLGDAAVQIRRLLAPPQHARRHDRQVAAQLDQTAPARAASRRWCGR